jgi:hypothetical protein
MLDYVELLIFANFIWDYISYILLFLHISKSSPHLTLYLLKGKKGVYRLKNYGFNKVHYLIKDMYDNVVTSVRTSDGDTNDFPINRLHQGSALSPYLFALMMDEVTRDI